MPAYIIEKDGMKDDNPLSFDTIGNAYGYATENSNKTFKICDDEKVEFFVKDKNKNWKLYAISTNPGFYLTKPPLGLTPRSIVETTRATDVKEAIIRYCEHGLEIPLEWIEEYNEWVGRNK